VGAETLRNGHLNNFDLIRLAAAVQVMLAHYLTELTPEIHPLITAALHVLPGVPVFFFISGFLVFASLARSETVASYAVKRARRIFPGLWSSVAFGALLVQMQHPLPGPEAAALIAAKGTILQAWNPDALRSYGTGVFNGALWTIPVELSFYVALPVVCTLCRRRVDLLLITLTVLSFAALTVAAAMPPDMWRKAALLTPVPWFGMFALGALAQRHFERLRRYVEDRAILWLTALVAATIPSHFVTLPGLLARAGEVPGAGSAMGLVNFGLMAATVLALAHTHRDVSSRLLRGNDLSYGIYLLHMPLLNAALELGLEAWCWIALPATLILAYLQWRLVEKPVLMRPSSATHCAPVFAP